MSKSEETIIGRRDLFRKATLGAGAVGAATVGLAAAKAEATQPTDPMSGAGYRETEHVKKYYELSRL